MTWTITIKINQIKSNPVMITDPEIFFQRMKTFNLMFHLFVHNICKPAVNLFIGIKFILPQYQHTQCGYA